MLKNLTIQLAVFISIFLMLSWLKTTSMLDYGQSVKKDNLVLLALDGTSITINNSNKRLVLYFFAPWCSICHASIENLQQLYIEQQDIDVMAIALDYMEEKEVQEFVQLHQLTFPVLYGNQQVKSYFKIEAYPSYYVLNEENTIISKSVGYSSEIGLYIRSL